MNNSVDPHVMSVEYLRVIRQWVTNIDQRVSRFVLIISSPPSKSFVVVFFTANVYYVIVCNVLDVNILMCNSVTKLVIFRVLTILNREIHFSKYSNATI